MIDLSEFLILDNETLEKLNHVIDQVIYEKQQSYLDYDMIQMLLEPVVMHNWNVDINDINFIIPIKRSDMLKVTLDFFRSIDEEFYNKVVQIILSQKENIKLNLYDVHSVEDFAAQDEYGFEKYTYESCVTSDGVKASITLPQNTDLTSLEASQINDDEGTLSDLYKIVHEISHLFDLSLGDIELLKKVSEHKPRNITRELFAETTAVTFERLFTKYLLRNTNYSKNEVLRINNIRTCEFIDSARLVYVQLLLARAKEERGQLCEDDIEEVISDNNLSVYNMRYIANKLIQTPYTQIQFDKKYAIAGIASPTIIKAYERDGVNVLNKYLQNVRQDNLEEVWGILGIWPYGLGISDLMKNMEEYVEELTPEII